MTTENPSIAEDTKFIQPSESQTLDSLLQNSCEALTQSETLENSINSKSNNSSDLFPRRSWNESVESYISTLKPKDTLIFIENIKAFSKGTVYMSDFRSYYFDVILKFLNGGEPLKTDFGRDEFTSLYSLYSFSPVSNENKVECLDTPMIFKVMESMDVLNFVERNPKNQLSNMKTILSEARNIFQCYDKIRNNHPKRKRYLIFVTCSDLLLDDINDLVNDMKSMKVRFSLFSPVKYDSHTNICDLLNYNSKGCKDLSSYYQSSKWSVILTHGLSKAFESANSCPIPNKKMKWNQNKEACDSTEYDFIMMNLVNASNCVQNSENISTHAQADSENSLNTSLNARSLTNNEQLEQNYGQSNITYNNSTLVGSSQSTLTHSKSQSKFMQSTNNNTPYYQSGAINQSQINKVNSMPCYYYPDQLYSAPNSVSVSSHRSTPSSIPHSQSPQFHMGNTHSNLVQQSNSVSEVIKPSSVESCGEIHGHVNSQKPLQMNSDVEMVPSFQRFSYAYNSQNNIINPNNNNNNMNPNRFVIQPVYKDPRNNSITLFEGYLIYFEDKRADIVLCIDQNINLSMFSMDSWDRQCSIYYVNYFDSYGPSLYGKNSDIEVISKESTCKTSVELQIIMNSEAIKTICNTVASKQNYTMAIVRPSRCIPPDVHVQIVCFIFSKSLSTNFKVIIPADPKNLLNEIKSRMGTMSNATYSNQPNQIYSSMKRGNLPNQIYNIPPAMTMPRQIINRYNSHNNLPMMANQVYRNPHPSNFINNQQLPVNSNYIMHSGQYSSLPNQSANHMIQMDMGLQSNQNIFDQNNY